MKPSIVVIGSSNTDMVIKADHLPKPGETILGGTFLMNAGGKGANQAVAAARLGGDVIFIGKTGNDIFGKQSRQMLEAEQIDTSFMASDVANPSGVALITVDNKGENCIVVAPGSNATLSASDIAKAKEKIKNASLILLQLEIPVATVEYAISEAANADVRVILNPAPACPLPESMYQSISIMTPNITEAQMLSGMEITDDSSLKKAAGVLRDKGVATIIITLGARGAAVLHENNFSFIAAPGVDPVDTTAAGDVFNGALAVSLAEGNDIHTATEFACRAAAISVTRMGAQSAAPYRHELQ